MKVRADIAELLRAGNLTHAEIARRLGVDRGTVRKVQKALGLPGPRRGQARAHASLEEAFWAHIEPSEDGHARWTGYRDDRSGLALVFHGKARVPGPRLAFRLRYGRDPVGRVTHACGRPDCHAGSHLADDVTRAANRRADRAFERIFGDPP
ncbi:helix-turn-helix domain-containing protein [Streptomyces cinnabarinus]|uniref:Helix-turn-helix domain-containing protein n=1 Tax=Streptomyces cinnabarinus TaxID=67287 RepID=A0ABY7KBA6_9ACTN|nr:helix-turn-helix domain-containing protein [Streptomyces cinnabarinus]WAZ20224.1 helix-turn-helix domain-containing protein [Streptomyces cinnabarinus]